MSFQRVGLVCLIAWTLAPAGATAQQTAGGGNASATHTDHPAQPTAELSAEVPADDLPEELSGIGRDAWREIDQLQKLESEVLRNRVVGATPSWRYESLAPFRGVHADLRRDYGLVIELQQTFGRVVRGSRLLDIEAVRYRLGHTAILSMNNLDEPAVRAYLDFFDGEGKHIVAEWLRRLYRFDALIKSTLEAERVPSDLIYVAMIESGFSPWARSPANAVGIWQFMAPTAREVGLQVNREVDERRDPVKATRAAATYLRTLYERFGSWPLALAAYNGGPTMVDREILKFNSNDFWYIAARGGFNPETRRYVPKVIAVGLIAKNADIFGLSGLSREPAWQTETVSVPGNLRLSLVAAAIGVDVNVVAAINPELQRLQTPGNLAQYDLRIPAERIQEFAQHFDRLSRQIGQKHVVHKVRFGETLQTVSQDYRVSPNIVRLANGLAGNARLRPGTELILPASAVGQWTPPASQPVLPGAFPGDDFGRAGLTRYLYTTIPGDTLDAIASVMGVTPADLVMWNRLDPAAKLRPGIRVQLFVPSSRDMDHVVVNELNRAGFPVAPARMLSRTSPPGPAPLNAAPPSSYAAQGGPPANGRASDSGASAPPVSRSATSAPASPEEASKQLPALSPPRRLTDTLPAPATTPARPAAPAMANVEVAAAPAAAPGAQPSVVPNESLPQSPAKPGALPDADAIDAMAERIAAATPSRGAAQPSPSLTPEPASSRAPTNSAAPAERAPASERGETAGILRVGILASAPPAATPEPSPDVPDEQAPMADAPRRTVAASAPSTTSNDAQNPREAGLDAPRPQPAAPRPRPAPSQPSPPAPRPEPVAPAPKPAPKPAPQPPAAAPSPPAPKPSPPSPQQAPSPPPAPKPAAATRPAPTAAAQPAAPAVPAAPARPPQPPVSQPAPRPPVAAAAAPAIAAPPARPAPTAPAPVAPAAAKPATPAPAPAAPPAPVAAAAVPRSAPAPARNEDDAEPKLGQARFHQVRAGEQIQALAQRYRVSVEELRKWNPGLRRSNALQPGQRLIVGYRKDGQ